MVKCLRIFFFIFCLFVFSCADHKNGNKDVGDVAGNDEVLRFMKTFEGRGDLTDTSQSVPAAEALKRFKVTTDLALDLVLSEPKVTQPVFITFDPQGRLWVVQYNQYPYPEGLKVLSSLTGLTELDLYGLPITDSGLAQLKADTNLHYINLVHTSVTASGIAALKNLKNLRSIYLYQSAVDRTEWPALKKLFPKTLLDSGGYTVPTLVTDTTEVKLPKKEKSQ